MQTRRVALFRGINVGQAKRVAMADLRKLFLTLGHTDVKTLLNSGNVVYSSTSERAEDDALGIEKGLAAKLGVKARVTVLDGRDVKKAVQENPLESSADDPSRLLLMVLRNSEAGAKLKPLLKESWSPEACAIKRRIAYLWCPDGILGGRLWKAADRLVGDEGTARNLATMTKLAALVEDA